ncbi:hypothetical protein KKG41_00735 [Patescibacteria group bacterium]|nr:hypothetical protein [Patescibacteria group bacterium]MBU1891000.1 hypothetical protein [Patescibacteria group bacterium]
MKFANKHSWNVGLSFGLTSGVITTLGLMVGLSAGTNSRLAVIGGILTIAIADSLSDALGIHISEESENIHTHKEIWISTFSTFIFKLFFALTFIIPVLAFSLTTAIIVSIFWGLVLVGFFSYLISRKEIVRAWHSVFEHLGITVIVIVVTHFLGRWINSVFS